MFRIKFNAGLGMRLFLFSILLFFNLAHSESIFTPPANSVPALEGLTIMGSEVGDRFKNRFNECDTRNTCDGKRLKYGCASDLNENTTILDFGTKAIFFNGKMGVDADGSPYSTKPNVVGQTNLPQTSLRYPLPQRPSINADQVPYIVIPKGGFDINLGIQIGDVGLVVYKDRRTYVVVADYGPQCKIGEGSIQLHELLGHNVCKARAANGECLNLKNVSIKNNVLYFIFPGTHKELLTDLTPENINSRIDEIGSMAWIDLLKIQQNSLLTHK